MADNDSDIGYQNDDEKIAAYLQPSFAPAQQQQGYALPRPEDSHPIAGGGGGDAPPPDLGDPNRPGPKLIPRGAAAAARVPQTAPNPASQVAPSSGDSGGGDSSGGSGGVTPWPELVRQGTQGALRNAQASENTVNGLAAQPSEADATKPLTDKLASDSNFIDPNQQQYKPTWAQKVFRGIKAGASGLAQGGVLGAGAGALNADYSAPNRQYRVAQQKQQSDMASDTQQLKDAQKAYEDQTNRAKGISQEERATGSNYQQVGTMGAAEQRAQEQTSRDAETTRHNQATEARQDQQTSNTQQYQQGELKVRNQEVGIQAARLQMEKHAKDLENANAASGGDANDPTRRDLVDKATVAFSTFKADWAWDKGGKNYVNEKTGKSMSQQDYINQLNKIGAQLDVDLGKKKQPPMGLRYTGGPDGQEIPTQIGPGATPITPPGAGDKPPAAPAASNAPKQTITTAHSKQQISEGDIRDSPHGRIKVLAVNPQTGKITKWEPAPAANSGR